MGPGTGRPNFSKAPRATSQPPQKKSAQHMFVIIEDPSSVVASKRVIGKLAGHQADARAAHASWVRLMHTVGEASRLLASTVGTNQDIFLVDAIRGRINSPDYLCGAIAADDHWAAHCKAMDVNPGAPPQLALLDYLYALRSDQTHGRGNNRRRGCRPPCAASA